MMFEIKRGKAAPPDTHLEDRLLYWQTVFRVQDWRVRIRYFEDDDAGREVADGSIHYWLHARKATIKVERNMTPEQEDAIICHEVMHLLFLGLDISDDTTHILEQALEVLVPIITGTELLSEEYPS